jgi:hypothetical protein
MKRIIPFILLTAIVLAIGGCGDKASNSTAPAQGAKNPLGGDAGGGKAQVPDQ